MRRCMSLAAVTVFMLFFVHVQPGFSQQADELKTLREDVNSLKAGQSAIQKDLQEIKKLLQARQVPAPVEFKEAIINPQGAPTKGDKNAKLVLLEFSDYQ